MPSPNAVKEYLEGGIYHIYNKSLEEFRLFKDDDDCIKFLSLLNRYLTKPLFGVKPAHKIYYEEVILSCFCLMDNHIHLLIKQLGEDVKIIAKFMKSLIISYTNYYNKKYNHFGSIFQGVYRARKIEDDIDLINVSKYIHLNPNPDNPEEAIKYEYSSAKHYLRNESKSFEFINQDLIMEHFGHSVSRYKKFLLN